MELPQLTQAQAAEAVIRANWILQNNGDGCSESILMAKIIIASQRELEDVKEKLEKASKALAIVKSGVTQGFLPDYLMGDGSRLYETVCAALAEINGTES